MMFSKKTALQCVLNRFRPEDFLVAMHLYQLGQTIGFSKMSEDDLTFLVAVLHDLKFGTELCIDELKEL